MKIVHLSKRNAILFCLAIAPLLQLVGDSFWVSNDFQYSWTIWRQASYIFFIPVGFLLAKLAERKAMKWAIVAGFFYVLGCFGSAAIMPIFRLGAFYPTSEHTPFPFFVQSVLDKKGFAASLFLPSMGMPVSLVIFGVLFLRHRLLNFPLGLAFIISGVLFWLGNAMELDVLLLVGDAWLLVVFFYLGYLILRESRSIAKINLGPEPC